MKMSRLITTALAAGFLCAGSAKAAFDDEGTFYFDNNPTTNANVGGGDGLWSTVDNWHSQYIGGQTNSEGFFPNSFTNRAAIAQTNETLTVTTTNICILDGDYTVQAVFASYGMRNGVEQGLAKITSPGGFTLTIDGSDFTGFGGDNSFGCWAGPQGVQFPGPVNYGATGARLEIDVPVIITNGFGNLQTWVRNDNNAKNETAFTTNSSLTLLTPFGAAIGVLETTAPALGSVIEINCPLLPSQASFFIQHDNLLFNEGHDSSNFGQDMIFQGDNSKLVVNGGTVLSPFRKFQINGNSEIEMNSAYSINGPDIVVALANNILLDVNTDQDLGRLEFDNGTVTIDLHPSVTNLTFIDSSTNTWNGPVVITNFMSEVVRFGTSSTGLTALQLSYIQAYDIEGNWVLDLAINAEGYLTGTAVDPNTPTSLYADWCALYPTLANTNFTHDADSDGIPNLMEYALGGNPVVDDAAAISPSSSLEEFLGTTYLFYIYERRTDALARGLSYAVLSGTDLTAGPLATATIAVGSNASTPGFETATNAVSTATEDAQFMNLKVEFTP